VVRREEVIQCLRHLIRAYPGRKADYYITAVSARMGVSGKKVSEYLKLLHQAGEIVVSHDRFYPPDVKPEELERHEQMLLDQLDKISKGVTHVTREEDEDGWYLVVYDIKSNIDQVERRMIYRRLGGAYNYITMHGGEAHRIQLSVWLVRGKEHAKLLASRIPEKVARVKIFKVIEEL